MTITIPYFSLCNLIFPLSLHLSKRLMGNPLSVFVRGVLIFRMQNKKRGRPLDPSPPCFPLIISLSAFPLIPWSLVATHSHATRVLWKLYSAWELLPPYLDQGSLLSEAWLSLQGAGPSFPWVKLLHISTGLSSCPKPGGSPLLSSWVLITFSLFAKTSLPFVLLMIDFGTPLNLKIKIGLSKHKSRSHCF